MNQGFQLFLARHRAGLSLRTLAFLVGCSGSWLSKIENERVQPDRATVLAMRRAIRLRKGER